MADRQIILNLIASMGLCDHMSDVAGDCWQALKLIGIEVPDDVSDLSELMTWLGREHGATTVWGTSVLNDDDDGDDENDTGLATFNDTMS